jgi:5-formyltetrahydrofolate cyclo-ligase
VEPFDPDLVSELTARAKQQLRRRARSTRGALPKEALAARSAQIVERVATSDAFRAARKVALFWPLVDRAEIDLRALDARAREEGKAVYYPFLESGPASMRTGFRLSRASTDLAVREQRFAEPPLDAPEAARGDIDLVVVPALAAGADGHRLGYGLGFYDATLPDVCPPARSLVVVYDFEVLAELPSTPRDVACDQVVTDLRTFERKA